MRFLRVERSAHGYGTRLWIGSRIRIGSHETMTPMWPHVYRSGDEFCNDVLSLHLYPLVAIDIWWRRKQRTAIDGICDTCKDELREAGWSDEAISRMEAKQITDHLTEQWEDELSGLRQ